MPAMFQAGDQRRDHERPEPNVPRTVDEIVESASCWRPGPPLRQPRAERWRPGRHASEPYAAAWRRVLDRYPDALLTHLRRRRLAHERGAARAHRRSRGRPGLLRMPLPADPGDNELRRSMPTAPRERRPRLSDHLRRRALDDGLLLRAPPISERLDLRARVAAPCAGLPQARSATAGNPDQAVLRRRSAALRTAPDPGESGGAPSSRRSKEPVYPGSWPCWGGDVTEGLAQLVVERGGHVRVGLEDYDGPRQPRNEDLVREVVALAEAAGRPVGATPNEAGEGAGLHRSAVAVPSAKSWSMGLSMYPGSTRSISLDGRVALPETPGILSRSATLADDAFAARARHEESTRGEEHASSFHVYPEGIPPTDKRA